MIAESKFKVRFVQEIHSAAEQLVLQAYVIAGLIDKNKKLVRKEISAATIKLHAALEKAQTSLENKIEKQKAYACVIHG